MVGHQGKDCQEERKAIMTNINKKWQQRNNNKINLELQQPCKCIISAGIREK